MSAKMTCPGCDSHTSGVLRAFNEGEPCPYCGLPATATEDILNARRRSADAELTKKYEKLVQRVARLEEERSRLRSALSEIKMALHRVDEEFLQ